MPTAVLLLLHAPVPPEAVGSVNVIVKPGHTDVGPVIVPAIGVVFTVIINVAVTVPQPTEDTV